MIVRTLRCAPLILCTFDNIFGSVDLDIIMSTPSLECLCCVICVQSVTQTVFLPLYTNLHNDLSHI